MYSWGFSSTQSHISGLHNYERFQENNFFTSYKEIIFWNQKPDFAKKWQKSKNTHCKYVLESYMSIIKNKRNKNISKSLYVVLCYVYV